MRRTYGLWILCLLLHTACDCCNKQILPYEEYSWGAAIFIDKDKGVTCVGSINNRPAILLSGEITKNVPGQDAPILCALFVTEDQSVYKLAEEIQKHQVKTDQEAPADALPLDTLYTVDSSFVNYKRVERSEGRVNLLVSSLDPAKGLMPGTKYNVWLAIKMEGHCFFAPDQYVTYESPDATTSTQVSMATAECGYKRDPEGDLRLDFSMQGEVKRLAGAGVSTAGFLLIEQGQEALTPLSVLEGHLQATYNTNSRELLSAATDKFTKHADGVIVRRAGSINADGSYEISQQKDPDGTLKKEKIYDVFALIERVKDGYYHYCVSQDSQAMKLPEVKMEVAMDSIGAPALLAEYKAEGDHYDIKKFNLQVKGRIVSHENTTDPIEGFLFVPQAAGALDNAAAQKKACNLIAAATTANPSPTRLPCFSTQTDSGQAYLVCITNTANVVGNASQPLGGQYSFAKDDKTSHLALEQDYNVYCWAQDAKGQGEVFLSANSKELSLLYVQGTLNNVQCVNRNCNTLPLQLDVAINNIRNGNNATMAAVFMHKNLDFDVSAYAGHYSTGWCQQSSSRTLQSAIYTWGSGDAVATKTYKAVATNGKDLVAAQQYTVHLLVRQGQVVYGIPSSVTYDTPSQSIQLESLLSTIPDTFTDDQYRGKVVVLKLSTGQAWLQRDSQNLTLLDPNNKSEQEVIKEALSQHYAGQHLDTAYRNYRVQ